jgi:hypothetical protein
MRPISTNSWMQWCAPVILSYGEPEIRIAVPDWLGQKTTLSKITRAQRAGGEAQTVEHLPRKCKALSSSPPIIPAPQKPLIRHQPCPPGPLETLITFRSVVSMSGSWLPSQLCFLPPSTWAIPFPPVLNTFQPEQLRPLGFTVALPAASVCIPHSCSVSAWHSLCRVLPWPHIYGDNSTVSISHLLFTVLGEVPTASWVYKRCFTNVSWMDKRK